MSRAPMSMIGVQSTANATSPSEARQFSSMVQGCCKQVVVCVLLAAASLTDAAADPHGRGAQEHEESTPLGSIKPKLQAVWPYPQQVPLVTEGEAVVLARHVVIKQREGDCCGDFMQDAMHRTQELLHFGYVGLSPHATSVYNRTALSEYKYNATLLESVEVRISETSMSPLQIGADESYELDVAPPQAVVTANTRFGAVRGLDTLAQLVDWDGRNHVIAKAPLVIKDSPRFPWRGVLVDTSRHFLSVDALKHTLDVMAWNKMNVLHWHLSDADSFPWQSRALSKLAHGAASWSGDDSTMYSAAAVQELIQYADRRGINIMPEIDMPGHTASWSMGYPEVTVTCWDKTSNIQGFALDPTMEQTYTLVEALITELADVFPSKVIHLGGDEVWARCWTSRESIREYVRQHNITYNQLGAMFVDRVQEIAAKHGRRVNLWDEVVVYANATLRADTLINVWRGYDLMVNGTRWGHDVVLDYGWYLDKNNPRDKYTYMSVTQWKFFYHNEPFAAMPANATQQQLAHVLGGEAASWGENVDANNLDVRLWTRTPAIAERLWSNIAVNSTGYAQPRLNAWRCKMARRGVRAGPIAQDYCMLPVDARHRRLEHLSSAVTALSVLSVLLAILATCTLYHCMQQRRRLAVGYASVPTSS